MSFRAARSSAGTAQDRHRGGERGQGPAGRVAGRRPSLGLRRENDLKLSFGESDTVLPLFRRCLRRSEPGVHVRRDPGTRTPTLQNVQPGTMLLHSAQKPCQEATWEFPEREIELVLTQAERKAGAALDG